VWGGGRRGVFVALADFGNELHEQADGVVILGVLLGGVFDMGAACGDGEEREEFGAGNAAAFAEDEGPGDGSEFFAKGPGCGEFVAEGGEIAWGTEGQVVGGKECVEFFDVGSVTPAYFLNVGYEFHGIGLDAG